MLAALSKADLPALKNLRTRADDDFTIALLDGAAVMADVLTFYQERLANESFLRTARERRSVLELARLIGYELNPGVAASVALAFTLDDAPGAPRETVIDIGSRVQSIPGPGEKPQTFETIEKIEAHVEWNAIRPRLTTPQRIRTLMDAIVFKGATRLAKGDSVLIVTEDAGNVEKMLRRVDEVMEDNAKQQTTVKLLPWIGSDVVIRDPIMEIADFNVGGSFNNGSESPVVNPGHRRPQPPPPELGVFAMRKRAALFGYNAPVWLAMADTTRRNYGDPGLNLPDWPIAGFYNDSETKLYLDQVYKEVKPNAWVVVSRPSKPDVIAQIKEVQETASAWFAISAQVTALTFYDVTVRPSSMNELRQTRVYIIPEKLFTDDLPETSEVHETPIQFDGIVPSLTPGQTIIFTGALVDAEGTTGAEAAVISEVTSEGNRSTLKLYGNLTQRYVRSTVRINANVAEATHGETVQELLGGGDASAEFQTFKLRQTPLTYVSAANANGAASTLEVRVNDLLWHETPTLYGQESKDHVYIARRDDDSATTLQFGDGVTGARLPSGQNNVRAKYRKGIGVEGLVKTGQLSMLLTRPLGVKSVTNPQAATGAQDPEQLDDARANAPLRVLTLDRVVSLTDYETFARSFAGIAKALATWTWDGRSRGVMVTVAGPKGAAVEVGSATYDNLLGAIRAAGDPFVELRVKTFRPAAFRFACNIKVEADFESDKVLAAVEQALRDNFAFSARSFGQPVILSEVISVIQAVPGVVAVDIDRLYRSGSTPSLQQRLLADLPIMSNGQLLPAELLTLDTATQLGVMV